MSSPYKGRVLPDQLKLVWEITLSLKGPKNSKFGSLIFNSNSDEHVNLEKRSDEATATCSLGRDLYHTRCADAVKQTATSDPKSF